jgi:hypothetical protein
MTATTTTEEDSMTGRHRRDHTRPLADEADKRKDRHKTKNRADVRLPADEGPDLLAWYEAQAAASRRSRNDLYSTALIEWARARGYGQPGDGEALAARRAWPDGPPVRLDRGQHTAITEEDHHS